MLKYHTNSFNNIAEVKGQSQVVFSLFKIDHVTEAGKCSVRILVQGILLVKCGVFAQVGKRIPD